jgi:hypothetical protein
LYYCHRSNRNSYTFVLESDQKNQSKVGFISTSKRSRIETTALNNNTSNSSSESNFFRLNGSHYSDPKLSWSIPIGVTAVEFLSSSVLGKKYENNIFVDDINNGNIYYFELNDGKDNSTSNLNLDDNIYHSGLADLVGVNKKEVSETN